MKKKKKKYFCVFFGIQHKIYVFENPISCFMVACCNRFVINESFSFPISYRLIFNNFYAVRLKLLLVGSWLIAEIFPVQYFSIEKTLFFSLCFSFNDLFHFNRLLNDAVAFFFPSKVLESTNQSQSNCTTKQ